ncbi:MAG: ATP-binding cassette domain-containing protein [Rickettsiales bacterium]|jgi:Fe-S cluster assembly ATP-binding protein|nr:ATP-binding cassette domain-containing protein [Rickettsiales bacterium]
MTNAKILEIKNLSAGVLKGINISVMTGARHLLRGANGSGKTTLAEVIIGNPDYPVKSGEIIFDGTDITNKTADERARLGVFLGAQNVPEIPGLSVMTFLKHSFMARNGNVAMGEFMKKLRDAQKKLDIPDAWLARGVNVGFSGGERKRLMFVRLLLSGPKLAILDEPDSGADKKSRKKFAEIINGMKETAFLIISHLDVFFEPTAETILQNGQIVLE